MLQFGSVFVELLEVIADLLTIFKDFFFAGSVADITSKLRSIFSQLLIIPAQLLAILFDFVAHIANVFEILSYLRLVVTASVIMMKISSVVVIIVSSVRT